MVDEDILYGLIGARLKDVRQNPKHNALTQDKLAKMVGLERTSITNIEAGKQKLPLHVLYNLCNALQVDISAVLPSKKEIADRTEFKTVMVNNKSYSVPSQIANLVRRTK